MPETTRLSSSERRRIARYAMDSAGPDAARLLEVRCPRNHRVAAVLHTPFGAVIRSVLTGRAHGRHDAVAPEPETEYLDLLGIETAGEDPVPAGCGCGAAMLSRACLRHAIAEGRPALGLAGAQSGAVPAAAPPEHAGDEEPVPVRVSTGRYVSAAGADYARTRIGHVLRRAPGPVRGARVRLTGHGDRAVAERVLAQANADIGDRPVRVQAGAATTAEAVDLLAARLKARLARLARRAPAGRGAVTEHEWRHGDPPRPWLPYFPRPVHEREVMRHKAFTPATQSCAEAAFDLEAMDYEFELFVEAGSGVDSVLYRTGDGGHRLAQVDPRPGAVLADLPGCSIAPEPAPVLSVAEAALRLEPADRPFVFFRDRTLGRGCVLYHRYDGHYGLITPAA
ncbi:sigma 54 modulation/S30EA ribosomal C-terminal domain-containing protein [Nocardia jiangsuensis]|uniref:Sigma 54 modulation/S30EA ribosomal C-terminal domain-containing protein n=1 Tax=Nocardia jiangsuensis TaxID=1691563 RepID=A0ABV8DP03_9NOCA